MKSKVLLAFVAAGAIALSSCTKKVDEKTMAEINQFSNDWAAMGEKATAWSNDVMATSQQAKDFAARQKTMMDNMTTTTDETMKTRMIEMNKMAEQDVATMETMTTEWNSFKTSWDENTKAYTEWKDKVTKGEVSQEDAMKGLTDWRAKLADAQTKVDSWGPQLAAVKESTSKNMAMADDMEKNMPTTKK